MSFFSDKDYRKPGSIEELAEELPPGASVEVDRYTEEDVLYLRAETVESQKHPDLKYEEKIEPAKTGFPTFLSHADYEKRIEAKIKLKDWEKILNEQGIWTSDRPEEQSTSLSKDPV